MKEQDPAVCAQCAKQSLTCCSVSPAGLDSCFPLSGAEIEAIRFAGYPENEKWYVLTANNRPFRKNLFRLFPGEKQSLNRLFALNGSHARLAVNAEYKCCFLTSAGCSLPREVRPVFCRLYPFWVTWSKITYFKAANCLVANRCSHLQEILRALKMTEEEIYALYRELRLKWGLD